MSFLGPRLRGPPPWQSCARVNRNLDLNDNSGENNMTKRILIVLAVLVLGLATLSASAQTIPPDVDRWVTPANGQTLALFLRGDVEALCGLPPSSSWDHHVFLRGIPQAGADWDTAVARLDPAVFSSSGTASTRIQVTSLNFASISPQATPCGSLTWTVGLFGTQPVTVMNLTRTASNGGVFFATISVSVEFRAFRDGIYLGSVYYSRNLSDSGAGVGWSFSPTGVFQPGISTAGTCIDVLRKKLTTFDPDSQHYYFISNLIAMGRCTE